QALYQEFAAKSVTGQDVEKLRDAIVSAFNQDDFDQLLRFKMDVRLGDIVKPGPFEHVVFQVIDYALRQGELSVLVAQVARARPRRADIQALYREFAAKVADPSGLGNDPEVQNAHGTYFGDKPPVDLQRAGAAEGILSAQDPGLERTMRKEF